MLRRGNTIITTFCSVQCSHILFRSTIHLPAVSKSPDLNVACILFIPTHLSTRRPLHVQSTSPVPIIPIVTGHDAPEMTQRTHDDEAMKYLMRCADIIKRANLVYNKRVGSRTNVLHLCQAHISPNAGRHYGENRPAAGVDVRVFAVPSGI